MRNLQRLGSLFAALSRLPRKLAAEVTVDGQQTERKPAKTYPHSSTKEAARRARQIAKGQLTRSNGLVWPGQLISRPDGKLYLQRPYC
jgi:hypothetical protein